MVVAIMHAKPRALRQDRFERKGAAEMRVEIARKVLRRVREFGHDPLVNIGDQPPPDFIENPLFEDRPDLVPIDREFAEMRHRREHVEGRMPLGRERRIGHGRVVEIEREILGQHAVIVNIGHQPLIARPEQDHVVRNPRPIALDPEMHDEQRRRIAFAHQCLAGALRTARGFQQIAIDVHHVAIARDHVGILVPSARGRHAGRAVAHRCDVDHRVVQPQHAAEALELRDHAGNQPVGPAHREPHAAVFLQLVDQRVDRACGHRVAADQQRMERQRLAQMLVLHVRTDDRINRAPRLIFEQPGCCLDHRRKVEKGDMAELAIALFIHARRIIEELGIARHILGVELGDFGAERGFVVRIIERNPVGPIEPVERHHRHQRDVIGHVAPGQRPEFLQARRIGDHGRTGIEGKTVFFPDVRAATGLVARLDDHRLNPGRLQPDRQREPAKARTDDDRRPPGHDLADRSKPIARIARGIVTGGLPLSTRTLSNSVDRPA